jgi:signal transduction histidine kinase
VSRQASGQALSLPTKVFLSFATIIAAFSLIMGFTLLNQWRTRQSLTAITSDLLQVTLSVIELRNTQEQLVTRLEGDPLRWRQWITMVRQLRPLSLHRTAEMIRRTRQVTSRPETVEQLEAMALELDDTVGASEELESDYAELYDALANGDSQQASNVLATLRAQEREISVGLRNLQLRIGDQIDATLNEIKHTERQLQLALLFVTIAALLMAAGLTVFSYRALAPLSRLTEGVIAVGAGDLKQRVDIASRDEIGTLASEFNRMTERLVEREERLRHSERLAAIGKFVAKVSHDVRNPLSAMSLNAELLEEDISTLIPEKDRAGPLKNLHTITERIEYLEGLTEEYLSFSRRSKPVLEPRNVDEVVEKLIEQERNILNEYRVAISLDLEPDLPLAGIDDVQFKRVIWNIVRNAREAMPGGGRLEVSTRAADGGVEIRIADTGVGMDPEVHARIFDQDFTTKERGTGLGLAIAQEIVTLHGGRISCTSTKGEGTSFTIWLPEAGDGAQNGDGVLAAGEAEDIDGAT